jgi:hypothetical protein
MANGRWTMNDDLEAVKNPLPWKWHLVKDFKVDYNVPFPGRSAARLAHLHGVQGVGGSNPLAPTSSDQTNGRFFHRWRGEIKPASAGLHFISAPDL